MKSGSLTTLQCARECVDDIVGIKAHRFSHELVAVYRTAGRIA